MTGRNTADMHTETIIQITSEHTDELGHLNHVAAVRYMEIARGDWYRRCGLFAPELAHLGTVVVNIDYDYRRECFAGETVEVVTRAGTMGTRSFVLAHEIVKPGGEIAVEGRATSVVMDTRARAIVAVPACLATHLKSRDA